MKSSSLWARTRRKDQFYRLAKERGLRSRASFKLMQALRKYRFMKAGDKVLDLGAAPGGWLQVARQVVGDGGYVLGVDVEPIKPLPWANVETITGDISSPLTTRLILEKLRGKADVVLSDVSPKISGVWEVDHARQIYLAAKSLEIAETVLRKNGSFFVKVFHGPELNSFKSTVKERFREVKLVKPKASKARSSEIYVLATGFLG